MTNRRLLLLPLAVAAAFAPLRPAVAAPAPGISDLSCVLLLPQDGGTLINRCSACREVTLERVLSGDAIPTVRAMMMPGEAVMPLPFRASGRIRIIAERACPPPPGRTPRQTATGN
ncbi:MAG: hypothetical protein U1E43_05980 [Rhodospirillales bacterium]